jgi:hypothetical protein
MNSVDSHLRILSSRFVSETNIPMYFLTLPVIMNAIKQYQWYIVPCSMKGWVTAKKYLIFND